MRTPFPFVIAAVLLLACAGLSVAYMGGILPAVVCTIAALGLFLSPTIAYPWEKAVVVRLGEFRGIKDAGLFWLVPGFDSVLDYVDTRIQTSGIKAEMALTKDGVSVDVDAVVFWQIHSPELAALEVKDYDEATNRVAQTSLREMIGASELSKLLSDRETADALLQQAIDKKTHEWGITVRSVEIRDVKIPPSLNDAMSRQAQAERESAARVTLAEAEIGIAHKMAEAAMVFDASPTALLLRKMGLIYEMGKNGSTILIPTDMASSLSSAVAGAVAGTRSALLPNATDVG